MVSPTARPDEDEWTLPIAAAIDPFQLSTAHGPCDLEQKGAYITGSSSIT